MSSRLRAFHGLAALAVIIPLAALGASSASAAAAAPTATYRVGPITDISACGGQNAEVEQAVDAKLGYVYEEWMGCRGIAVARSTDGGRTWGEPVNLPDTVGSNNNTWDPAIAVAPDGTVYASFMLSRGAQYYPVVDASFDHGASFAQSSSLIPPDPKNWGDRDFIAVGPDGTVYVTWDYGPERTSITYICASNGSCAFGTGDLNVVMQKSVDGGKTWSRMSDISPGFPASGADSAPLVIEPDGRIDVLYQGYQVTNPVTYALSPAHSYFTASADGGVTWSSPVRVGPGWTSMAPREWWIDGSIGRDTGGNLYVTWDSQRHGHDVGWLSFSANGGASWSRPIRVNRDQDNAPHIVEVAGGFRGTAYVGWLSDNSACGYVMRVRAYSIFSGWLGRPVRVASRCGRRGVWPGGTFGFTALPPQDLANGTWQLALSWGSAVAHRQRPPSEILSSVASYAGQG